MTLKFMCYVGCSHRGMEGPEVANGVDGLQMWRVVANKQSRTAEKNWCFSLGFRRKVNSP